MAYKFTTGSVDRGDIYNEDDAQGNTYLDWNEAAVGVVAGGSTIFLDVAVLCLIPCNRHFRRPWELRIQHYANVFNDAAT